MISRHRARSYKACPGGRPVSRLPRRSACRRWRVESRPRRRATCFRSDRPAGLIRTIWPRPSAEQDFAAHKALCLQSIDQSRYVVLGDQKALLDLDLMPRISIS